MESGYSEPVSIFEGVLGLSWSQAGEVLAIWRYFVNFISPPTCSIQHDTFKLHYKKAQLAVVPDHL